MRVTGTRDLHTNGKYNRKPYRTPSMKKMARELAVKVNGTYVVPLKNGGPIAPVLRHPVREDKSN